MSDKNKKDVSKKTVETEEEKKLAIKKQDETMKIANEFLKLYQVSLTKASIQYRKEYGPGLLVVIVPNFELIKDKDKDKDAELDLEYYPLRMLPSNYRKTIIENPKRNVTVNYLIKIGNQEIFIERELELEKP